MIPTSWSPEKDPTGWYMSEFYDGIRALWDGENFILRNEQSIYPPKEFLESLPSNAKLDGVLWYIYIYIYIFNIFLIFIFHLFL